MKKEISKGTQKFIWHLVAFVAVFVLALVIICRVLPEPNRTAYSTQVEHPDRFELNSLTAKTEQSSRRD